MFEIGNSLREARLRQSLDFGSVEAGTKIRGKYIQALEAERFDVLPGETYVKGFLRTYAEFLGLDGQLYVDEFNSRFASAEEPLAPSSPSRQRRERRVGGDSNLVVVALAAIVAVTILVVVAFGFGSGEPTADPSVPPQTSSSPGETGENSPTTTSEGGKRGLGARAGQARPDRGRRRLLALRSAPVAPRESSSTSGRSSRARSRCSRDKRLWLQVGQPAALKVTLNGFRVADFPAESGAVVVVTASGIRQLAAT